MLRGSLRPIGGNISIRTYFIRKPMTYKDMNRLSLILGPKTSTPHGTRYLRFFPVPAFLSAVSLKYLRPPANGVPNMAATASTIKLALAAVVVAGATVVATCPLTADDASAKRRGTAESTVVFFDDFSSTTLDRSKWNVRITGVTVNNEQQACVDSPDTIYITHGDDSAGAANGALVIQPRYRPGFTTRERRKFDFISGRIDTKAKMEFAYGTAAARIKLPAGAGLWPAFWALGNGRWPDTGEIDIMENVGEPDWTSVALHGRGYFGETPLVNKFYFPTDKDASAWHVYSVDW